MSEYLEKLEKKILADFYERNDSPQIEVLLDYKRVWARYLDRKTFLWEGETIDDGFNDMKTFVYLRDEEGLKEFGSRDEIITYYELHKILGEDLQRQIERNKEIGIDVKVIVCNFYFCPSLSLGTTYCYRSLLTTYKMERL
jgi:hypothetical protein